MYPVLRIGLARRYGQLSAAGTLTNGRRHNERTICVEDITLMSERRSSSILISAFHVACTNAAPRTITNTSTGMEASPADTLFLHRAARNRRAEGAHHDP